MEFTVRPQEILMQIVYNDIMKNTSPSILKDNTNFALMIIKARFQMPKYQAIILDTRIANPKTHKSETFKTKRGNNHMIQSLPERLRKQMYDSIMENGSPEITKDLDFVTFFCHVTKKGKFTVARTFIENTSGKSEAIKISFAKKEKS